MASTFAQAIHAHDTAVRASGPHVVPSVSSILEPVRASAVLGFEVPLPTGLLLSEFAKAALALDAVPGFQQPMGPAPAAPAAAGPLAAAPTARRFSASSVVPPPSQAEESRRMRRYAALVGAGSSSEGAILPSANDVIQGSLSPKYNSTKQKTVRDYEAFAKSRGLEAWPANFDAVSAFMVHAAVVLGHEPKGIKKLPSAIRTTLLGTHQWQLSAEEDKKLSVLYDALCRTYVGQNSEGPKLPVTMAMISAMRVAMLKSVSPSGADVSSSSSGARWQVEEQRLEDREKESLLFYNVMHQGMLRGSDVLADSDLCCNDTSFIREKGVVVAMEIRLRLSKTDKAKGDVTSIFYAARNDEFDVVSRMRAMFERRGVSETSDEPLFRAHDPVPGRGRKTKASAMDAAVRPLTRAEGVRVLRGWLKASGVPNSEEYGTHGFRSGGLSEAFHAGVKPEIFLLQGRWSSEEWKKYFRGWKAITDAMLLMQPAAPTEHSNPSASAPDQERLKRKRSASRR